MKAAISESELMISSRSRIKRRNLASWGPRNPYRGVLSGQPLRMRFSSSPLPFESLSLIVARSGGLFVTGGWRVTTPPFNPNSLNEGYGSVGLHGFCTKSTASTKKEKRGKKEETLRRLFIYSSSGNPVVPTIRVIRQDQVRGTSTLPTVSCLSTLSKHVATSGDSNRPEKRFHRQFARDHVTQVNRDGTGSPPMNPHLSQRRIQTPREPHTFLTSPSSTSQPFQLQWDRKGKSH